MIVADGMRERDAIDWLIRQREPDFNAWEAFEAWLSADPANAEAYQTAAAADADLDTLVPAQPVPEPMPMSLASPRRRMDRRRWIGGAIAAAAVGMIGYAALPGRPEPYAVETAPGQRRTLDLAPGTRIALNGGTRIVLDRRDPRRATLDRGQAVFEVRHDAAHPFALDVAGVTLMDAGTVFEVTRDPRALGVAVAEGMVVYNPEQEAIKVGAGQALAQTDGRDAVSLSRIAPGEVGAWRTGRLSYDGSPIARVAADLSRNLGVPITASPAVATRPFRGVIGLQGGAEPVMASLGPLLDVRVERARGGWSLSAR